MKKIKYVYIVILRMKVHKNIYNIIINIIRIINRIVFNALCTELASFLLSGMDCANRENTSLKTRMYLYPLLYLANEEMSGKSQLAIMSGFGAKTLLRKKIFLFVTLCNVYAF